MKKIILLATLFLSTIASNAQVVSTFAGSGVAGSLNGTGTSAQLNNPSGICKDNLGNFYVADTNNNKIRKITSAGVVSTFAGSGVSGSTDGTGTTDQFNLPTGVCVDASGNVYVADKNNNKIRKITSTGVVTTFAGSILGYLDGIGTAAKFNLPTGVCIDNQGNIYVADSNNNKIRKITTTGVVTTLAGSGFSGYADGAGTVAQFNLPTGVCADVSGNIYVADQLNNRVREVSSTGLVTTIVSYISLPTGICADNTGNVYVSDQNYHKITQINPSGTLTYLVGSGTAAYADGFGSLAQFNLPFGICTDTYGNVYVADSANNRVRKILICNSANSPIITITPSTTASVCPGQNVILSTTGVTSYTSFTWNSGQTISTISVNPIMSYSYSLTATNAIGCSTASLVVTVIPNNYVVISGSNTTCLGQNVTLTASGVSSYSWNNGSTSSSITVNPTNVTTYSVTGTDACGFVSTNSFEVNVINTNPAPQRVLLKSSANVS